MLSSVKCLIVFILERSYCIHESCDASFDGPVVFSGGHQFKQVMGMMGWIIQVFFAHGTFVDALLSLLTATLSKA